MLNRTKLFKDAHQLAKSWYKPCDGTPFSKMFYQPYAALFARALKVMYAKLRRAAQEIKFQRAMAELRKEPRGLVITDVIAPWDGPNVKLASEVAL